MGNRNRDLTPEDILSRDQLSRLERAGYSIVLTDEIAHLRARTNSNAEKKKRVVEALRRFAGQGISDRHIARLCDVSHTVVQNYRRELERQQEEE
jgi:hypothetical protein